MKAGYFWCAAGVALLVLLAIYGPQLLMDWFGDDPKDHLPGTKWESQGTVTAGYAPQGTLTIDFKPDGAILIDVGSHTVRGKYFCNKDNELVLNLDGAFNGRRIWNYELLIHADGNHLTLTDPDGAQLHFTKVK
jgi:hypothetical protein